jgi:hypothetical protein
VAWLAAATGAAGLAAGCGDIEVAGLADSGGGGGPDSGPQDLGGGGGEDVPCPGGVCPSCASDEECRTSGRGFWCQGGECTTGGAEDRFLLVLAVTGAGEVVDPQGIVSSAIDETFERIDLDASGSVYVGPGTPSWTWTLVDDAGVTISLQDAGTAHAWFAMPPIWQTAVFELRCAADDGTGAPGGAAGATVIVTVRNVLNEPPVVELAARPAEAVAGQLVILDATGTWDPNGDGLALPFRWEQTAGPAVPWADASIDAGRSVVSFAAPMVDEDVELRFRASVADDAHEPAEGSAEVGVLVRSGGCEDSAECNDGNSCTTDACGADRQCHNEPVNDGAPCSDGDVCTTDDRCRTGVCRPGSARVCPDDDNPCTAPVCAAPEGCRLDSLSGLACDDGDRCTTGDRCVAGVCLGTSDPAACQCTSDGDCDDGNRCNGSEYCDPNTAACARRNDSVVCPALPDPCKRNVCLPQTGACATQNAPDGADCDDGRVCTWGDRCEGGTCRGEDAPCDDGNPCTWEQCVEESGGCAYSWTPGCCRTPADCQDFDECTEDRCSAGQCSWATIPNCGGCGSVADCDDGDPCTIDVCVPATGECTHQQANLGAACEPLVVGADAFGGMCDAAGACVPFTRQLWGASATSPEWGSGIHALWRGTGDSLVWAAGWRNAMPSQGDPGRPLILRIEDGVMTGVAYAPDDTGAFTDISGTLAVGPGGAALFDRGTWDAVLVQNVPDGVMRRLVGQRSSDGSLGGWYVVDEVGGVWYCSYFSLLFLTVNCEPDAQWAQLADAGPIVGAIDLRPLPSSLPANVWYLANDGWGKAPIWHGSRASGATRTYWTTGFPGCSAENGDAGCATVAHWTDAWRDGGAIGSSDADGDIWGVGWQGAASRLTPRAPSWAAVNIGRAALRGLEQIALTWTGVWVAGPHVVLVGYTDTCLGDRCTSEVTTRSLVAMYYDGARNAARRMVILGQVSCAWSPGAAIEGELPLCRERPVDPAVVSDVWGVVERDPTLDGDVMRLWLGGAWPVYERGNPNDVRAALWTLNLRVR